VLPHAYPFRLVERADGPRGPVLGWTAGGAYGRGGDPMPVTLAVEMMAQAALLALPAASSGSAPAAADQPPRRGLLAGLDGVRFHLPVVPGDSLEARAELAGAFGRLVKARVMLLRSGSAEVVAEGELLLALDETTAG
jgi:3-hydroxymyristoyl/3-hydroxydecanoyl-(acyl carrier protein) dehydratase